MSHFYETLTVINLDKQAKCPHVKCPNPLPIKLSTFFIFDGWTRPTLTGRKSDKSVVIDGKSLIFALNKREKELRRDFFKLLSMCSSVICCRVSPIQKAEVVELVQEYTKDICLAIGDGANDVAMIQKAHIGVGISGNEGLQAANNSDFAIAQFRFLKRLLLLHGAWFHTRIAKVIYWSFYKNICLYIIDLWFASYSYWSGQTLYESYTKGNFFLISVLH